MQVVSQVVEAVGRKHVEPVPASETCAPQAVCEDDGGLQTSEDGGSSCKRGILKK